MNDIIIIRQEPNGALSPKLFVLNPWPTRIRIAQELFGSKGISVNEEVVSFEFENGCADYRKIGESLDGHWVCDLL